MKEFSISLFCYKTFVQNTNMLNKLSDQSVVACILVLIDGVMHQSQTKEPATLGRWDTKLEAFVFEF